MQEGNKHTQSKQGAVDPLTFKSMLFSHVHFSLSVLPVNSIIKFGRTYIMSLNKLPITNHQSNLRLKLYKNGKEFFINSTN